MRPDIVVTREDGNWIILVESLVNNPRKNYGLSQGGMYQMHAYSKKYDTPEIWLLCPLNEDMKNKEDIVTLLRQNKKV